jgi:hypothetical protein
MMAEIASRGPISCGIDAGPLANYTGGIIYDHTGANSIDHIISVIGKLGESERGGMMSNIHYWRFISCRMGPRRRPRHVPERV